MNREQLEEIRARAEAATEGPWFTGGAGRWPSLKPHELIVSPKYPLMEFEDTEQGRADAKFVAAARTDVPALLDEIDRQMSTLHAVLMGAAEDYRQCIVAARASMSDADYQRCNGRAEAYRQAATRLAESSGLPIPDWDRIRREVPADGVYRSRCICTGSLGSVQCVEHGVRPVVRCGGSPAQPTAEGSAEGGTSKGSEVTP